MNIVDIAVIAIIILGGLAGLKRGFTREIVSFLGFFLVVVLSFYLKNPISQFLYENLPFFNFWGIFKGVTVLNIAVYEFIALMIAIGVLTLLLKVVLFATKIFEKLLTLTIVLGIPSKILGAIVGLIEGFVWVFILLYIFNLPFFNFDLMQKSKYSEPILNNTPILSSFAKDSVKVIEEFKELQKEYKEKDNAMDFNYDTLKVFLRYNIIDIKSVDKLVEKGKIKIDASKLERLLRCYREETKNEQTCESIR